MTNTCEPIAEIQPINPALHFLQMLLDNFEKPASKKMIAELPIHKISNECTQCCICLKNNICGELAMVLPCYHYFHVDCILQWLNNSNSCPICRNTLPIEGEDYEEYWKRKLGYSSPYK